MREPAKHTTSNHRCYVQDALLHKYLLQGKMKKKKKGHSRNIKSHYVKNNGSHSKTTVIAVVEELF